MRKSQEEPENGKNILSLQKQKDGQQISFFFFDNRFLNTIETEAKNNVVAYLK